MSGFVNEELRAAVKEWFAPTVNRDGTLREEVAEMVQKLYWSWCLPDCRAMVREAWLQGSGEE